MDENRIQQVEAAPMLPAGPDRTPASMVYADPAAVAAAEMAKSKIQLAYFMATQAPRNQREAWGRIMEACRRPAFAAKAIYAKPVGGGQKVEGPSVRLAEEVIRQWRNIMVLTQVVYEDDRARRVAVQVIDLESNNQFLREIVTPKTVERKNRTGRDVIGERLNSDGERVFIVRATEDEMANRESALISKAVRNEGLRLVPADVIEDAMSEAKRTRQKAAAADPDFAIKSLVFRFGEIRVGVADLERYVGGPIDKSTVEQIDDLEGILQAIRDRETTWAAVIEMRDAADPSTATKTVTTQKVDGLKNRMEASKAAGGAAPAGATNGGKDERPAAPAAAKPQQAEGPPPPSDRDDPGAGGQASAKVGDNGLADDPDRQFAAVGFAVVDLPDLSLAELAAHANRIKGMMETGEKRTLRPAMEAGNASGVVAVLAKVARREAAKAQH
jgi:hypothetical protein